MATLGVTKVVGGKKIVPKKPQIVNLSKAYFVRLFISQLNAALVRDARVITKLHLRKNFINALIQRINKFTNDVLSVLDSFPAIGERSPAAFLKNVQFLKQAQKKFIIGCRKKLPSTDSHSRRTRFVLDWLANDVKHFATQIEMTFLSISVAVDSSTGKVLPPSLRNLPNRHRNPMIEIVFLSANTNYRNGAGQKEFAPYKFVLRHMQMAGVTFSERTYRLLKTDYKQGKFGKLVR